MSKQKINKNYEIENLTKEGKKIRTIGKQIGNKLNEEVGFNFMNGGCYLFAKTIKDILDKKGKETEYIAIGREYIEENGVPVADVLDHIVVKVKEKEEEIYIDADGIATKENLEEKIIYCDGILNPVIKNNLTEEEIETKINSLKNTKTAKILEKELKKLYKKENKTKKMKNF